MQAITSQRLSFSIYTFFQIQACPLLFSFLSGGVRHYTDGILYDGGIATKQSQADDIQFYGWDNIAHVVICDMLTSEQADYLERYLIKRYKATWRDCGYNRHPGGKF